MTAILSKPYSVNIETDTFQTVIISEWSLTFV